MIIMNKEGGNMKPSKEQFEAYVRVQESGVTNMWYVSLVCDLAGHGLTEDHVYYIFDHYSELRKEYMND